MFTLMSFTEPNIRPLPFWHFLNSASYSFNLVWILLLTRIHRLRPLWFVSMICLGILDGTVALTLEVPTTRLTDLQGELKTWQAAPFFTKEQLQSLLGKLSFVTACVKPGRIFMIRLLNSLRKYKRPAGHLILFPLLCSWTFSGGLIFFHGFIVFLLLSIPSEILRV